MKVRYLRRALADLDAAYDYIRQHNPNAAGLIADRISNAIESLKQFPQQGRPGRKSGTRELVVSGTPFIVPYRVRGNAIEILAVIHGARRWPERLP